MTTESMHSTPRTGVSVLLGAALAALVLGLLAVGLGALVGGPDAAWGALAGTLLVVGVFALGSFVVNTVAGFLPAAALLVALLTYTLQVVLMAVAFAALRDSGLLDETIDRRWLAGAVIGGTVCWLVTQTVLTTRLRIPAYDLPADQPEGGAR